MGTRGPSIARHTDPNGNGTKGRFLHLDLVLVLVLVLILLIIIIILNHLELNDVNGREVDLGISFSELERKSGALSTYLMSVHNLHHILTQSAIPDTAKWMYEDWVKFPLLLRVERILMPAGAVDQGRFRWTSIVVVFGLIVRDGVRIVDVRGGSRLRRGGHRGAGGDLFIV